MENTKYSLAFKHLVVTGLLVFFVISLNGQSLSPTVVASGGNFAKSGSYSLSYTIGEPVITTIGSGSYLLTQGFQQPGRVMVSVDPELNASINWNVDVYPNPFGDMLNVRIEMPKGTDSEIVMYNLLGVKMQVPMEVSVTGGKKHYVITGDALSQGVYFVNVYSESLKKPLTFKVIKL